MNPKELSALEKLIRAASNSPLFALLSLALLLLLLIALLSMVGGCEALPDGKSFPPADGPDAPQIPGWNPNFGPRTWESVMGCFMPWLAFPRGKRFYHVGD